jgi:hypothetical protein
MPPIYSELQSVPHLTLWLLYLLLRVGACCALKANRNDKHKDILHCRSRGVVARLTLRASSN